MTLNEAFRDGKLAVNHPWSGCTLDQVTRWCQENYRCSVEVWLRNRDRWEREDAEDTRRSLYPTPRELIADEVHP